MVGFTLLSRSYYYLRRRSPGPPFPPDHRQAGERRAIKAYTGVFSRCDCEDSTASSASTEVYFMAAISQNQKDLYAH